MALKNVAVRSQPIGGCDDPPAGIEASQGWVNDRAAAVAVGFQRGLLT